MNDVAAGYRCLEAGAFEEALRRFQQALGRQPALPAALEGAGHALNALGRPAEALQCFGSLQTLDPKSAAGFHGAGESLQQLGKIAEARQAFEQAVSLAPDTVHHHYALAQIARFMPGDTRLPALEKLAQTVSRRPVPEQGELYFALGKAYDELGRYEEALAQFNAGNDLRRRFVDYDETSTLGMMAQLAKSFTPALMAAHKNAGDASQLPVFVVGMPRSGTSLVEQILASHPQVFGAGEPMYSHELLGQGILGPEFPFDIEKLPGQAFRRYGSCYVSRLKADAPHAARIVDKLPANFMLVGLIKLAMPNAHIIHVQRNALDTCFSCYASLFSLNIDYTYDLGELGRYYRAYETLMAHWRALLPEGALLELRYEDLVADVEGQARRIVDYCGLAWDEACLSFHNTSRVVHTLSATQVREPIYRRAIGRATPYRPWLGALMAALERTT